MKKASAVFVILLMIQGLCLAQNTASTAGTSSNLLLRFGTSSKVSALSESFTGLANDINALYYNPAGLPHLRSFSFALNHSQWLEDIRVDNILFGYGTERFGFGLGMTHMWMPPIQGKDYLGNPTDDFDVSSSILDLGIGFKFIDGFHGGLGIKYFQDNLADVSAAGMAFDLGLFFRTIVENLTLGVAVQNIGGSVKYIREEQDIPLTFRTGIAYQIQPYGLTISSDLVKSIDTDYNINFGVEYMFQHQFALRVGNRYGIQGAFSPSVGTGLAFLNQYFLDYSFYHVADVGATHRMGFTYYFRQPEYAYHAPLPPVAPQNLTADIVLNAMILTWEPVKGASYNVEARLMGQDKWLRLNRKPLRTNSMKFKVPSAGEYEFRVSSIVGQREGRPTIPIRFDTGKERRDETGVSEKPSATLQPGAPSKAQSVSENFVMEAPARKTTGAVVKEGVPDNLKVTAADKKISVSWDPVKDAQYYIYVLTPGGKEWARVYRDPLYSTVLSYPAKKKGTYQFRITAVLNGTEGPHSEEVTIDVR